jgi:biotin transport system substrate-specific component
LLLEIMRIQDIAYIALFAAITAVLGLVPKIDPGFIPIPITAQSLGPMLAGAILGASRGAASQALFLLLLAAGIATLSGGRTGLAVFAGPSAGFIVGFVVAAFVIGALTERMWHRLNVWKSFAINVFGGIAVLYALGIPALSLISGASLRAAALGSAVFLPGDLIKAALAASLAMFVKRGYPVIRVRKEPDRPQ